MTRIEIDLENYKDEVKYTFCENNNCLLSYASSDFKKKFGEYLWQLERDIYFYKTSVNIEDVLRELKYMYAQLN